jgi:hypothetical protein
MKKDSSTTHASPLDHHWATRDMTTVATAKQQVSMQFLQR